MLLWNTYIERILCAVCMFVWSCEFANAQNIWRPHFSIFVTDPSIFNGPNLMHFYYSLIDWFIFCTMRQWRHFVHVYLERNFFQKVLFSNSEGTKNYYDCQRRWISNDAHCTCQWMLKPMAFKWLVNCAIVIRTPSVDSQHEGTKIIFFIKTPSNEMQEKDNFPLHPNDTTE